VYIHALITMFLVILILRVIASLSIRDHDLRSDSCCSQIYAVYDRHRGLLLLLIVLLLAELLSTVIIAVRETPRDSETSISRI
jgi:hypothetical protein